MWITAATLSAVVANAAPAARDPRPSILFVLSDDHGTQAIGAYGSRLDRTPSIDRLASEGMRFDRCFCCNSICAPSRATILTGLHSHRSGHTSNERIFTAERLSYESGDPRGEGAEAVDRARGSPS